MRAIASPTESVAGFEEMVSSTQRKYYMLGGKGGVGKTSCAASLAVKFANHGHPTIVVSTDPAHSLSDSFGQVCGNLIIISSRRLVFSLLQINTKLFFVLLSFVGFKWRNTGTC